MLSRTPRTTFGDRSQSTIRARGTRGDPSTGRIRLTKLEGLTFMVAITVGGSSSKDV